MSQLSLNLEGYDTPNNCGVYVNFEAIKLDCHRKSWRGSSIAEIRVANTQNGFDWGVSLHMSNGGFCYMPNKKNIRFREFARSRADAIKAASQEILSRISKDGTFSRDKSAAVVRAWLDEVAA